MRKLDILNSLEEGKITVDEAYNLLGNNRREYTNERQERMGNERGETRRYRDGRCRDQSGRGHGRNSMKGMNMMNNGRGVREKGHCRAGMRGMGQGNRECLRNMPRRHACRKDYGFSYSR